MPLRRCLLWLLTWKLSSKPEAMNDFPGQNQAYIAGGGVLALRSKPDYFIEANLM